MSESSLATLVLGLLAGVILLQALVLLTKPSLWVQWLVARPWKSFGVDVNIVNAARLIRKARWLGLTQLAIVGLGVYLYFTACGGSCRP